MSKKIISLLLTLMLTVSMVAVAAVSVSAEVDEQCRYTPSEGIETNRYYFYMPSDWYNDCAFDAGIYWWLGSDAPSAWPGYGAQNGDADQVYYCDVPVNSTVIIWNNGFDGGEDSTDPNYAKAIQTVDIQCQFYANGDSDTYDSAWFAEMEESFNGDKTALGTFADNFFYDEEYDLGFSFNFDNMIYIINPYMISENPSNGKITCGGEWYFYYGNGEYGTYPTKEETVEKGTFYTSDYQPAKDKPATEPVTDATEATSETPSATDATLSTESSEPVTSSTPYLTVNATSNYFPKATAEYNEATKEVTVTYWMKSSKDLLDTQWDLYYDSSVLSVSSKNTVDSVCPTIGNKGVINFDINDVIKYNATNLYLFDFTSEEKAFVSIVFDVNDITAIAPVTTTVDLDVKVLRVSKVEPLTLRSDENEEVMLCNFSEVIDDDAAKTVQVDRRTQLTTPYEEPTSAETTVTPSEEESTVPDTTAEPEPNVPYLTVNATSNYFPKATADYIKSTNEVVVTYWMKSDMDVLDLQWYVTYDSEILTLTENNTVDTVCPVIGDKAVMNLGLKEKIKYNASNLYLFDFSSAETPFAQFTFNVNDLGDKVPATTTIDLTVEVLRVSQIDDETLRSDKDKEIILVDNSQVLNNEQTESVGVKTRTTLTPSTYVVPTTTDPVEPTTTEPVEPTTEPETVASSSLVENTTSAVAPATDSTSATGTTSAKSTSDTPSSNNGNNGSVQTGDTSLAVIILSILIGATCVMFVLRKREMF